METQVETTRHCPVCGTANPAGATHCQNCEVNLHRAGEIAQGPVGFLPRLGAYAIDGLILLASQAFFGLVAASSGDPDAAATIQCLSILATAAYLVAFWTWRGQTPGKMALGIKIVKTDGSPVTFGTALGRYIGYWISGLAFLLGFLWVLWGADKQGWHDKIAGTYVVRV